MIVSQLPRAASVTSAQTPIYLDANATTAPLPKVVDIVSDTMRTVFANPSSAHWIGGQARVVLEKARDALSTLVPGSLPEGVTFNSGGTEGNNTVLAHFGVDRPAKTLITTAVEHPSVSGPAEAFARSGGQLFILSVGADGLVDPDELRRAIRRANGTVLVSIQWANSETGIIQPVQELVADARQTLPEVLFHIDIAQAVGRVPVDLNQVPADVVTFSGHKLHGPQGIGAMVFRDPDERRIQPLLLGGGQERGVRSGTQNVAGAAGLGMAARMRTSDFGEATRSLAELRDTFEGHITASVQSARVNGLTSRRVPNTSSISFARVEGLEVVARLDAKGVACSVGSACSSAKPEASHVLTAMGLSESEAFSTVRFSFSILNTMEEAVRAAGLVADTIEEIR